LNEFKGREEPGHIEPSGCSSGRLGGRPAGQVVQKKEAARRGGFV